MSAKIDLDDLDPEQLSMIASSLAIGDVFCCAGRGHINAATVARTRAEIEAIAAFAYDGMGCEHQLSPATARQFPRRDYPLRYVMNGELEDEGNFLEPTDRDDHHRKQRARKCLSNFFEAIGCRPIR